MERKNMEQITSVQDVNGMTPEALAAAQVYTNTLLRERLVDAIAEIDAGKNVQAFAFTVRFHDDPEYIVALGGEGPATFALLDNAEMGILANTVKAGILMPGFPERLSALHAGGFVHPMQLLATVIDGERIVDQLRAMGAAQEAANESEAIIKRASGE